MVGKIRHIRQKIHQEAVKFERPSGLTQSLVSLSQTEKPLSAERQSSAENQKTDPAKNAKKVSTVRVVFLFRIITLFKPLRDPTRINYTIANTIP